MDKKVLKKSPLTIVLYVIAAILLIYAFYMVGSTITYLHSYFSAYGSSFSKNLGTSIGYICTQSLVYFVYAIIVFVAAKIYNEVRALNDKNYLSAAESKAILKAKEAKAEAKAAEKKAKANRKAAEKNAAAKAAGKKDDDSKKEDSKQEDSKKDDESKDSGAKDNAEDEDQSEDK